MARPPPREPAWGDDVGHGLERSRIRDTLLKASRPEFRSVPVDEAGDALAGRDLGPPPQHLLCTGDVGDVHLLVPRSPVLESEVGLLPAQPFHEVHEFEQRKGVLRATAHVEHAPPHRLLGGEGRREGLDEVLHVEDVSHLLPVAVDREGRPAQDAQDEVGHPTLVLVPRLARPVDARHPEARRRHPIGVGVVLDVEIGGQLRYPVRRVLRRVDGEVRGDAPRVRGVGEEVT